MMGWSLERLTERRWLLRSMESMADQDAADNQEGLVDIGSSFVAAAQSTKLVKPGQRALNHPPVDAQATAMGRVSSRQQRPNVPSV